MGPVSGQVLSWLGEALHLWSADRPGLAGLRRELEARDEAAPLGWQEFTTLCARLEPLLGGHERLVEAARDYTASKLGERSHQHIGFSDERQALWFASQALGPSLLPELQWSFHAIDAAHVRISVSLSDASTPSAPVCALIEGALAAVPRAAGRGFARVRCGMGERRASFEIETTAPDSAPLDTRRLATLAAHSGAVFIEANSAAEIIFVSPNCTPVLGFTPERLVGRKVQELTPPQNQDLVRDTAKRLAQSDEPVHVEFPFTLPDGSDRWGACTCHTFRTDAGDQHVVAVVRDVTAHREVERIRQERFDLLDRVAKAAPDAMLIIDVETGEVTNLSGGELDWLGGSKESFAGTTTAKLEQLIHPDDLPGLATHRQRAHALPPGGVCQTELRVRQPDGSWRWLRLRDVVFSRKEDGSPREFLVSVGDVTEQVETAAALGDSQERYRRISELASDYSFCVRIDRDGTIEPEWMTDAYYRITGYDRDHDLHGRWQQLVHPDDHALCQQSYAEGLRTGSGSLGFRLLTRTGEIRWIQENFEVVRQVGGGARLYGACRDVTEQRLAEQARQQIEDRYRALTENSWDIVGELDTRGIPTYISPNVRDVLGWEPEELLSSDNAELFHPSDRPVVAEQFAKLIGGEDEVRMEIRVRHKQGGWRHLELTATAFRPTNGPRRGVFLGRDVTERLQMKAEHERLGSVVSASSELIAIFEPDGRLLFLNRAGRRMTGLGSRALGNTSVFELMELPEATRLRQEAFDTALHERPWEGECQVRPVDGEESIPVLANVFRLPGSRPEEDSKLALVARDIRARKRAETALHESEQRFRMLVENAFDLIAEVDDEGIFLYASPRYHDLLGYDTHSLIGQPILDLLHEEDRPRVQALVESFGERPSTDLGLLRVRGQDGAWHWIENQVRPYQRGSGETVAVVVSRDVTDRKETEEALRVSQESLLQSQKMEAIGRLAGGVAHDFNNLLTAITGYGDLIHQELGEGDPLREDAAEILRAAEQASGLTRQLLAFSRRQVLQPRVVELNGLVSDVDRLLRRLIGEHIEFRTSLAPNVGPVRVDPGQIEQLLVNLAVNARDAMPGGGLLGIVTEALELGEGRLAHPGIPPGSWITLAVSDTGEGMDQETIERIFEPFFTTKATGKGTGLGLSTVYGIVQQSSGHIRVDSEADRGTTFTVYLPRCEDAPDRIEAPTVYTDLRGSETVVLVEDEEIVRRLMVRYLEEHGYPVIPADSAVDALRAVRRHEGPIDLLITDVVLPKMDGHALAERLRRDHPALKVLFISGFAEDDAVPHAVDGETEAFIQKPFAPPELLSRARALLAPR